MALLLAKLTSRRLFGEGGAEKTPRLSLTTRFVLSYQDSTMLLRINRQESGHCWRSSSRPRQQCESFPLRVIIATETPSVLHWRGSVQLDELLGRSNHGQIGSANGGASPVVGSSVQFLLLYRWRLDKCASSRAPCALQHHRQDHETATLVWDGEQLLLRGSATRRNACHAGGSSPRAVCLAEATHREVSPSGRARV